MLSLTCAACSSPFFVDAGDQAFYQKMTVPHPTHCPKCRLQRRLAWRNERTLYKRHCSKSGREMISNLGPDAPFPVYHVEEWNKDDWQAPFLSYDFSRPFFDQFKELMRVSPRQHKATAGNEVNAEYMNHAGNSKNCYYTFNSEYNEDCYYMRLADHCRDCVDGTNVFNSELCYECVNVDHGYNLRFSDDCKGCSDSWFLRNCRGVKNSIFCYGLEQKEYHVFNEPKSKEEYEKFVAELKLNTWSGLQAAHKKWMAWSAQFPLRRTILQNCENSTGEALYNCKNALDCFSASELQDCRYVLNTVKAKDSYDLYAYGEVELALEYVTAFRSYNVKFSCYIMNCSDIEYSDTLWNSKNCFGCVGLKGRSYCILNKQYTKEEYEKMVPKIVDHMRKTKEWGEFSPPSIGLFAYNETIAQNFYPLTKEQALKEGFLWRDETRQVKEFKLTPQEVAFYKREGLPAPTLHPNERYRERLARKLPRRLWDRACGQCGAAIQTPYAPERPEKVVCEKCYLKAVI